MIDFNQHLTKRMPWQHAVQEDRWFTPGDTRELWLENMQDEAIRDYFATQGWDHDQGILYRFNHWGFRGDEFVDGPSSLVVLGCSFTFGVGLREQQTWPWILAKTLGTPCYNLAWGGGNADRCFRLAEFWLPKLRPKFCVILTPPNRRLELILNDQDLEAENIGPNQSHDRYTKIWMTVDENARINSLKNQLALRALCDLLGIKVWIYDTEELAMGCQEQERIGRARDLMHSGPAVHESFAARVTEDIAKS